MRDGLSIKLLQEIRIEIVFLSGARAGAIPVKAKDLGIRHCLIGIKDKAYGLHGLLAKVQIEKITLPSLEMI